jgi:hypothetical protein
VSGGPEPQYLHDRPGFAFDVVLTDIARTFDVATAQWTAKALELPTDGLVLDGPAWPWGPTATLAGLALAGAAAFAATTRLIRRIRSRRGGDRSEPQTGSQERELVEA